MKKWLVRFVPILFAALAFGAEDVSVGKGGFAKALTDGSTVATRETRHSEMRRSACQVLADGEQEQRWWDEPYEVRRLDLLRMTADGREPVWSAENAFPESLGPWASGTTPLGGVIVWDVAESPEGIWVLASINTRIFVHLQAKNDEGEWETRSTHELGAIFSIRFSGKLEVRNGGIRIETAQWDEDLGGERDKRTEVFEITQDGFLKCSGPAAGADASE